MKKIKIPTVFLMAATLLLTAAAALFPTAEAASAGKWIASWTTAGIESTVTPAGSELLRVNDLIPAGSTVRTELQLSAGGLYLRFKLSNEYGEQDVTVGAASVAQTAAPGSASVQEGTSVAVTFRDGLPSVTIPAGESVWSDTVYFPTSPLEYISVSLYYPRAVGIRTAGLYGGRSFLSTPVLSGGAQVGSASLFSPSELSVSSKTITYHTIPFLTNVDVRSVNENAYTVVFLGDSTLTNEAYHYFAQRAYSKGIEEVGFVNNSIVANRLLYDGVGLIGNLYGQAVIDRFDRDALQVTGAKAVLVKIGLNDILHPRTKSMAGKAPQASAQQIIAGYEQLITRAHRAGMKIYFFTNTAWKGYERSFLGQTGDLTWTQEAQDECDTLDRWIRSSRLHDGYFDMSPLSDPTDTAALLPALTSDGAHLTTLGAVAMADLISPSVIGTRNLPLASQLNGMDPYATRREVPAAQAQQTAPAARQNTPASTAPAAKAARTGEEDSVIGENALASRLAVMDASAKAEQNTRRSAPVTAAPTTAKSAAAAKQPEPTTASEGFFAKVKSAFSGNDKKTQTEPAKKTAAAQANTGSTVKKAAEPAPAGNPNAVAVTQKAAAVAASREVSIRNMANVQIVDNGTPSAAQSSAASEAPATAANEYSIVAAMEEAGVQIEVEQNPAYTPAQPGTNPEIRSNGTAIGILMIIVLVGVVAGAILISTNGQKRKFH